MSKSLQALLAAGTPFLDVRAPGEFNRGSVPGAVNLPVLDDAERHRVGVRYKQAGNAAAVALGHRLVSGSVRAQRERLWCEFAAAHPGAWIYCWRGGQRSAIVQAWLRALGFELPRIPGGFKALRRTCLDVLERTPANFRWLVLGGRTGSGKTELLKQIPGALDLEGIARHRGSAFGAMETPQPTPVTFDSLLAVASLQHRQRHLIVEDESRTIGRLALPASWHARMQRAPLAVVDVPLATRVANIRREYLDQPIAGGRDPALLQAQYADALRRIERRLGGLRRRELDQALSHGFTTGEHEPWIERLLVWYYDPMYDHQLQGKGERIVVQGCEQQVLDYLAALD